MERITKEEKRLLKDLQNYIVNTSFIYHDDGYRGSRFVVYDNEDFIYSSETRRKTPGPIYYKYEDQGNGHGKREFGFSWSIRGLLQALEEEDENNMFTIVFVSNYTWRDHLNSDCYWGIPYADYSIKIRYFKKVLKKVLKKLEEETSSK